MPATTNKQQALTQSLVALKKKFPPPPEPDARPVLEEVLYAILREGATPEQADAAYRRVKQSFFDWNEIRVSTVPEVADALADLPDAGAKATRVVGFLQEVFEERYSFDLNDIAKKDGLKRASKQLARYKSGVTDFVVAWVTQRALGGHAVPLDGPTLRVLGRLGVIEGEIEDLETLRGSLEHFVPKAKGIEFTDVFAMHAAALCTPDAPDCPHCPLKAECPTGQEILSKPKVKPKSR